MSIAAAAAAAATATETTWRGSEPFGTAVAAGETGCGAENRPVYFAPVMKGCWIAWRGVQRSAGSYCSSKEGEGDG